MPKTPADQAEVLREDEPLGPGQQLGRAGVEM